MKSVLWRITHLLFALVIPIFIVTQKYKIFNTSDWKLNILGFIIAIAIIIYLIYTAGDIISSIKNQTIKGLVIGICLTIPIIICMLFLQGLANKMDAIIYTLKTLLLFNIIAIFPLTMYYKNKGTNNTTTQE